MASTKASGATDRIASLARVAIISSGSLARTARISARSVGARCAPPVHIASFRSRVARPCRRSSTISGFSSTAGSLPQVLLSQYHSTERAGRTKGRHRPAVQLQQHCRRVSSADVKLLLRCEMQSVSGGDLRVRKELSVCNNAHMSARRGGNRKREGHIGRGGGLLGSAIRGHLPPCIRHSIKKQNQQKQAA